MTDDLGFSFVVRPSGDVAISRDHRVVTVLRGRAADRFLGRIDSGANPQHEMARVTGNYKRGNERRGS